jgi:hypothetical protein
MAQEVSSTDVIETEHELIRRFIGTWEGTAKTMFEPGVVVDESPWRGEIRPMFDGRFITHETSYQLMGKSYKGMQTLGYNNLRKHFECAWLDEFHMGNGILFCVGQRLDNGFAVVGSWTDGSGGPDWGWRIEFRLIDADAIDIEHFIITPTGEEASAIEIHYKRVASN